MARPRGLLPTLLGLLVAGSAAFGTVEPARAQGACAGETEPNDAAETAPIVPGALCVDGTLDAGDQDLWRWDVAPDRAALRWTLRVVGVPGTLTSLKLIPITSAPGATPITGGAPILSVDVPPDGGPDAVATDVLLPVGRYVLGISRSGRLDGTEPTDVAYQLHIDAGTPLPPSVDAAQPADPSAPLDLGSGAVAASGDLQGGTDRLAWTAPADAAGHDLLLQGPVGAPLTLTIHDPAGTQLLHAEAADDGRLVLDDLALAPGAYRLTVGPPADGPRPWALTIVARDALAGDPEPNDTRDTAAPLSGEPPAMRGRLARPGDRDHVRLDVDPALAAGLVDLRLLWRSGLERSLCLLDDRGARLQCARGTEGLALMNLGLTPGSYVLEILGEADAGDPYLLRVDSAGPRDPGFEAEPNDTPALASPLDPAVPMRGRLGADDRDVFRVTIDGAPQQWRLDATGSALRGVALLKADGSVLARGDVMPDGTAAVIHDLVLIPGEHWVAVDGDPGDYTVALTPLGAPDTGAEREPNNELILAEAMDVGETRSGRLADTADVDVFRFTLAAPERVRIRVDPPADGAIDLRLESGGSAIVRLDEGAPGEPVTYDALLPPGDHELWLRPMTPSDDPWTLALERLDALSPAVDQEPNDDAAGARPVPPTLRIAGDATGSFEPDWYRLAPLVSSGPVVIHGTGAISGLHLVDGGGADVPLTRVATAGSDAVTWTADALPAGSEPALRADVTGPYTLRLEVPGVIPVATPDALPVTLGLVLEATEVAAAWPSGQRVTGSLLLTNEGTAPAALQLDAATSHHAWRVELADGAADAAIEVPAGETVSVPVAVLVPADVPSHPAVAVTLRARAADGAQATATLELLPDQDLPPVHPEPAWSVPAALLGGLDAAALGLGGVPAGDVDADAEALLHDGVTPSGGGFATYPSALPLALTVDLAGDAPVPVAGTILNPQANGHPGELPRDFDLELSEDGTTWRTVLSGELSPAPIDQAFVLPEPVPARAARLVIRSLQGASLGRVVLGEWKVIAAPGIAVGPQRLDLADPALGGHIVTMTPGAGNAAGAASLLDADLARSWLPMATGERQAWVVGFAGDRLARVAELGWTDPEDSDPDMRFRVVDVEVSEGGPVGPWTPLGTWRLERDADGRVAPFVPDAPVWARFLRFTGDAPHGDDPRYREQPGELSILEAPTDATYRSAVAEWGQGTAAGPWEWSTPQRLPALTAGPDGDDTPETATPLVAGTPAEGRVRLDRDVDWYRVTVPDGHRSLRLEVGGLPTVGVSLTLVAADGAEVPMTFGPGGAPGSVAWVAGVEPGASYNLRVQQPPFSAVITFDTSGSMRPYHPAVVQAVRAFTADVTRGREAVTLIPFEEEPLLPGFSDEPFVLQDAIDRYVVSGSGSSGGEAALIDAAHALEGRPGARAILVITDGETSTYPRTPELWAALDAVRPLVFAVHVGGDTDPVGSRARLQDWAAVGGGVYQYARSQAEVDRAFDRMATWLRRPAGYTLRMETAVDPPDPPEPGALTVEAAPDADGSPGVVPVAGDAAIELVLDTSGSMLERLSGMRRIDVAKQVLLDLVQHGIAPGTPVALRQFEQRPRSCRTELSVPLAPLDPATMSAAIEDLAVLRSVRTPLAGAIEAVAKDLEGVAGQRIVVVVSDGEESCGGDPAAAVQRLADAGVDVTVNVVGLGLDARSRKQIRRLATIGGGTYFDARDPAGLDAAIAAAVSAPFSVFDVAGDRVATGTVGGTPVTLPPGTYRVVVHTEPEETFEAVVVDAGGTVRLALPVRTLEAGTADGGAG